MVDLSRLNVAAIECRDFRHAWETETVRLTQDGGVVTRTVSCGRCGTMRSDRLVRRTGELRTRKYGYAEGYRIVGQGRTLVSAVRKEWFNRFL